MLVVPRKYPYNASYKRMILCGAIVTLMGYCLAQAAMTNDRGLSIDYIINFDTSGATIFYWSLCGFCVLGGLVAILAMVIRRVSPKELEIDDNGITIPYGFMLSKTKRVNFSEISNITETVISRQTFLNLYTPAGKVALMESLLPEKNDYEDIKEFLQLKLKYSH
ncbi:MAG: hypothetical protein P4L53_06985 [Candidatus Obscuribacterales bacterium]|nr:hypothetical protein [Candidatus Obscuribacterales bacterium]